MPRKRYCPDVDKGTLSRNAPPISVAVYVPKKFERKKSFAFSGRGQCNKADMMKINDCDLCLCFIYQFIIS